MSIIRNRFAYIVMAIVTMILGISSRKFGSYLPEFVRLYVGDILWALMVYLGFAFIMNKVAVSKVAIVSLIFSFLIEFSQLYQSEWINDIRATTLGSLVLGHRFLVSDLVCYTLGILTGVVIDNFVNKRNF